VHVEDVDDRWAPLAAAEGGRVGGEDGRTEEEGIEAAEAEAPDASQGAGSDVGACPNCGDPKLPHRVCPTCGMYKGEQVVEVEEL
jgi:hypothetical protein